MPEFGTGLVFPGSENVISLGGFWFNIEGAGVSQADRITMDIYALTYKQSVACMERGSRVCVGGTRRLRLAMRGVTPSKNEGEGVDRLFKSLLAEAFACRLL